jgi:hypothetical protein
MGWRSSKNEELARSSSSATDQGRRRGLKGNNVNRHFRLNFVAKKGLWFSVLPQIKAEKSD